MRYIGIGSMRIITGAVLRDMQEPIVITRHGHEVAIVLKYQEYLDLKQKIQDLETLNRDLHHRNGWLRDQLPSTTVTVKTT